MNAGGLIGGIGGPILAMVFVFYVGRAKGNERSRRLSIAFGICGALFLVLGLSFTLAVKVVPELEKAAILLIAIAIAFLLFGCTLLGFAGVYKTIRELQEKATDQLPSDKV